MRGPEERGAQQEDAKGAFEAELVELAHVAPPSRGPRPQLLVAGVLAGLFGLVLLVGSRGGLSSPSVAPSTTAPASTDRRSATPTIPPVIFETSPPGEAPAPGAWTEFELRGYGRGSSVANIWTLGDLFVIEIEADEGPDGGPFGPVTSVLLASEDGTTLSDDRVDLPVAGFAVEAGAVGDGRLYVLGATSAAPARQLWSTADGTWRLEPAPLELVELEEPVVEIAYGPDCGRQRPCAAAGWVALVGVPEHHDWEAILVSADGASWVRPQLPLESGASLSAPTLHGDTWHVLARSYGDEGQTATHILRSSDLVTWRATEVVTIRGAGRDLASGAGGLVLVGSMDVGDGPGPRAWLSRTGAWLGLTPEMLPGRAPAAMDLIAPVEGGYVAMSSTSGDAWISTEGRAWANIAAFAAESGDTVRAVAATSDVLLAGGRSASGRPAVWRSTLSELFGQQ